MLTPHRLLSPLLAAALAALPVTPSAQAATAPPAAEPAGPAEAPGDPAAEGADDPEAEGLEGDEGEALPMEVPEPEPEPEPEAEPEPAPVPAVPEGPERPPEPRIGGKPAKGKGMMISGGVLLGGGIAGTIAAVVLTTCPEPAATVGCRYAPHRNLAVPIAASFALAGTLLLAVGVGTALRYKRWEGWTPEEELKKKDKGAKKGRRAMLVPTLTPDGAGLGYVGRF